MLIAVGGECDSIAFYNLETEEMVFEFKAHENRIKALYSTYGKNESQGDTGFVFLFSVSSDGLVKLWQLDKVNVSLCCNFVISPLIISAIYRLALSPFF